MVSKTERKWWGLFGKEPPLPPAEALRLSDFLRLFDLDSEIVRNATEGLNKRETKEFHALKNSLAEILSNGGGNLNLLTHPASLEAKIAFCLALRLKEITREELPHLLAKIHHEIPYELVPYGQEGVIKETQLKGVNFKYTSLRSGENGKKYLDSTYLEVKHLPQPSPA